MPWRWLHRKRTFCWLPCFHYASSEQTHKHNTNPPSHQDWINVAQSHSRQEGSLTSAHVSARCSLCHLLCIPQGLRVLEKGLSLTEWWTPAWSSSSMTPVRHAAIEEETYLYETYLTVALFYVLFMASIHHSLMLLWFTRTPKINRLDDSVGQVLVSSTRRWINQELIWQDTEWQIYHEIISSIFVWPTAENPRYDEGKYRDCHPSALLISRWADKGLMKSREQPSSLDLAFRVTVSHLAHGCRSVSMTKLVGCAQAYLRVWAHPQAFSLNLLLRQREICSEILHSRGCIKMWKATEAARHGYHAMLLLSLAPGYWSYFSFFNKWHTI